MQRETNCPAFFRVSTASSCVRPKRLRPLTDRISSPRLSRPSGWEVTCIAYQDINIQVLLQVNICCYWLQVSYIPGINLAKCFSRLNYFTIIPIRSFGSLNSTGVYIPAAPLLSISDTMIGIPCSLPPLRLKSNPVWLLFNCTTFVSFFAFFMSA